MPAQDGQFIDFKYKQFMETIERQRGVQVPIDEQLKNDRPPLGIPPKHIWQMERFYDVRSTIFTYMGDALPVKKEWIEEYNELIETLGNRIKQ